MLLLPDAVAVILIIKCKKVWLQLFNWVGVNKAEKMSQNYYNGSWFLCVWRSKFYVCYIAKLIAFDFSVCILNTFVMIRSDKNSNKSNNFLEFNEVINSVFVWAQLHRHYSWWFTTICMCIWIFKSQFSVDRIQKSLW